jgi:hypothetical protein
MPCKIIEIEPTQRFKRQVIENIHHQSMTAWDLGKAFQKLLPAYQTSLPLGGRLKGGEYLSSGISKMAKELGVSDNFIQEKLALLGASPELQKALKEERIAFTHVREVMKAPPEFQKQIESKILRGEFNRTNSVTEVVHALKRNPQKSKEILAVDYSKYNSTGKVTEVVSKIAPRVSDQIRESYNPVNRLSAIIDDLVEWLQENPPQTVGVLHAPRIVLNLAGAVSSINEWGVKAKQLKLKGNSDGN